MTTRRATAAILFVLGLGLTAGAVEDATIAGKAVTLAEALAEKGVTADPEMAKGQVAVVTEGGEVWPLVSDVGSRALFLDERLRGRKAELKVRKHQGLPYVQVMSFRVEEAGSLAKPEYVCDICTISVRYPQICPCCQEEMELRFRTGDGP